MTKIFILEKSIRDLLNTTDAGFETSRKTNSSNVQVINYNFIPSQSNNTLEVRAKVRSSGTPYDCIIQFENIEFYQQADKKISLLAVDGSEYSIYPIRFDDNTVKVRCSCLDFYYRFSVWNHRDKALFGDAPDPYVNKTKGHAPVNPEKVSGMCKHLIKLTEVLKTKKIIY